MLRLAPLARASAVACIVLTACTDVVAPGRASPDETVSRFIAAWDASDYAEMTSLFTTSAAEMWTPARLERWFGRTIEGSGLELEVAGGQTLEPAETRDRATARYSVTFTTADPAPQTATLDGELPLVYERERWVVDWREQLAWPGVPGARGIEVRERWMPRGAIVDRDGRVLAKGHGLDRRYPQGTVAGSTVGHLEPAPRDAKGLEAPPVGASGLEAGLEERLAGIPRTRTLVVSRLGHPLMSLWSEAGRPGRTARTTLDVEVQRAAEQAFGSTVGGAVVIDPSSGDLLAVVSSGPFDPGNYVGAPGVEPFNRALSGAYPPGSAMKVVTAAAALDTRTVTENTELTGPAEYRGVRNFESGEFGTLDFADAVRFSVNTAFAQVALDLGGKKLTRYAESFGFNRPPEPPLEAATSSFPEPEDEGDLMWGSIGQAQVLATPLQMASVAATIANGGMRREPGILRGDDSARERVVSRKTAATLTRLMEGVVNGGTGVAARLSGVRVAGKTGTAEVDVAGERRNHAWFVCFAPANDPEVAVAVVSEYGGVGGQVAAPLARGILAAVLPLV